MLRYPWPVQTRVTVLKHNNHIPRRNPRDSIEQVPCGSTFSRISCGIQCLLLLNGLTSYRWTVTSQKFHEKYMYTHTGLQSSTCLRLYSASDASCLRQRNQIISLQTSAWINGPEDWKLKWWITLLAKCNKARKLSKLFLTLVSVLSLVSFLTQWRRVSI
jgi:hypothetical protein